MSHQHTWVLAVLEEGRVSQHIEIRSFPSRREALLALGSYGEAWPGESQQRFLDAVNGDQLDVAEVVAGNNFTLTWTIKSTAL